MFKCSKQIPFPLLRLPLPKGEGEDLRDPTYILPLPQGGGGYRRERAF